jgi:hypothetical protein
MIPPDEQDTSIFLNGRDKMLIMPPASINFISQNHPFMKKTILILAIVWMASRGAASQDYDLGIGIKAGMAPGISAKYFLMTHGAIEGIATFRWSGANLAVLAEFHLPVFDTEGMSFYYGGGLHVGVWDSGKAMDEAGTGQKFNMGVDGIVGLEYALFRTPLSVGLDWKPNFNIVTDPRIIIDEISLVLRYLIR